MPYIWISNYQKHEFEDDYSNVEAQRRPHGIIFYNGKQVADTLMCPHCGGHFVPKKGQLRRTCLRHNAKVCDKPMCNTYCWDYYESVGLLSSSEF